MDAENRRAVEDRALLRLEDGEELLVRGGVGRDYGGADRRATRLPVKETSGEHREEVARHLVHLVDRDVRIGEVHAIAAVDLNIDVAGHHEHPFRVDDLLRESAVQNRLHRE